jgi:hypothetical protein
MTMSEARRLTHLSRRRFLKVGGLGTMLTLSQMLWARATAPASGRGAAEKSCIFIVQQGGCTHLDTWDMKPNAPAEYRGPLKPIATPVPGVQICELMPRMARLANRYALIRSMTHGSAGHDDGMHVCLSGQSKPERDAAYYGSVMSKLRPARRNVPSYVWIQEMEYDAGPHFHTGGFLGAAHAPLRIGKGDVNFATPGFRMTAFDPPADVTTTQLLNRQRLLGGLDSTDEKVTRTAATERFQKCQERAFELVTGPEARRAFDLRREPEKVRERYGRHPLGQNLLAARRSIEAGVRLVSVHAFTGFDGRTKWPPVVNVWDMHGAGGAPTSIFSDNTYGLPYVLPRFDQAVSALLEDLEQRGLLESTLVIAVGEFGRTPRITGGGIGRDHYPACYSALFAGAGIRGGAIYGASDRIAAFPKENPVSPEDFAATLFHALGVPPETRLSPDGFTRPASTGKVILDLFG